MNTPLLTEKEVRLIPKTVPVNEGWEGYVLANNIYKKVKEKDVLLLRGGRELTLNNIFHLKNHGMTHMNVLVETANKESSKRAETTEKDNEKGG